MEKPSKPKRTKAEREREMEDRTLEAWSRVILGARQGGELKEYRCERCGNAWKAYPSNRFAAVCLAC